MSIQNLIDHRDKELQDWEKLENGISRCKMTLGCVR